MRGDQPRHHTEAHHVGDAKQMEKVPHSIVPPAATVVAAGPRKNIRVTPGRTIVHVSLHRLPRGTFPVSKLQKTSNMMSGVRWFIVSE